MKNKKEEEFIGITAAIVFALFFSMLLISAASDVIIIEPKSSEEQNSSKQLALVCLEESREILSQIINASFNFERVNDTLVKAQAFFDDTVAKKKGDFSLVLESCEEIKRIKDLAFISRDEFSALKKFYNESITPIMNSSKVDGLIDEIQKEIDSERYEKVQDLVDKTYEEIIDLKSSYTALEVFRRNTANFLIRFFTSNWEIKLVTSVVLLILFLLYRRRILKSILLYKMNKLEIRRNALKGLIRNVQQQYFEKGTISEGNYNIKIKKFAEMIRDIDRQIPLFKEELVKLNKGRDTHGLFDKNEKKK